MAVSAGIPILVCMTGDATTPEIPPGLLEEYLAGMRVLLELLVGIADRLAAVPGDTVALEELRRETHKIHGSAGSYGFSDVSRLAAGMEETVKDWVARPDDRDVDRGSLTRWFVGRLADMLGLGGAHATAVPRTAARASPSGGPVAASSQLNVPEVICVEDDPALAELLEYGLRTGGYRFLAYRNGREALRELLALDVGGARPLLLLDVDLPELDGHSIFEALRRERPGIYRVVFTTVRSSEVDQMRALEAGALDYLIKPISLRVLLEKIRRWLRR